MDEWKLNLANAILAESDFNIEGGEIEHQCGSVYITKNGKTYSVSVIECEGEDDV